MSVLDDLLARPDQTQILDDEVLPELATNSVSVTDWITGSLTKAAAYTIAKLRAMTKETIATIAAVGFGDYVFGFTSLPNATAEEQADLLLWAPIVARQNFGIVPIEATRTRRTLTLSNSTATTYSKVAGSLIVQFSATGNRYTNAETWTSAGSDAVDVLFQSEFAVDTAAGRVYNDVSGIFIDGGATVRLVTAQFPGVLVSEAVLVAQGRNAETPPEMGTRCRAQFPLLNWSTDDAGNFIPPASLTMGPIESLTRRAFDYVKVCKVRTEGTINNKIIVAIAQQGAAATGDQVTAVQAFWDIYNGITDLVEVVAASTQAITIAALTITVRSAQATAAKAAIQAKLVAYLGGVDQSNVLSAGGTVEHGYIVALIRTTPGVLGLTDTTMTINGAATSYALAADTIATWAQTASSDFTWVLG